MKYKIGDMFVLKNSSVDCGICVFRICGIDRDSAEYKIMDSSGTEWRTTDGDMLIFRAVLIWSSELDRECGL